MPNLERFESRFNDCEWETCEAAFDWTLEDGENRLEVRPVNAFGRPGATGWVAVVH